MIDSVLIILVIDRCRSGRDYSATQPFEEENPMNMKDIKEIAVDRGVKSGKLKKAELVRAIQKAENNPECFSIGVLDRCVEYDCLWRGDCC